MIKSLYQQIVKPIVFRLSADQAHSLVSSGLRVVGAIPPARGLARSIFSREYPVLQQTISGVFFPGPIGLSAGFDPNGLQAASYRAMGFGWAEIGSVTHQAQQGNPPPHYGRLISDRSLIVNKGLKNQGVDVITERLRKLKELHRIDYPLGISIARTTAIPDEKTAEDYIASYRIARSVADLITINVSCPNVACFTPEVQATHINEILRLLKQERAQELSKGYAPVPVWIKIGPDHSDAMYDELIESILASGIEGIVLTNLVKDRSKLKFSETPSMAKGGISGKLLSPFALRTLRYISVKTQGRIPLIAVGGVMSAEDAYERIRSGASLIQLITGWIYEGPTLMRDISEGLVRLLERDGIPRLSDAVGIDVPRP